MVDLFEEVEEGLRADRMKAAWRKAAPWVLGGVFGVLVIGGGLVGWQAWQDARMARASESYEAILKEGGDPVSVFESFGEIAERGPAGYKSLALMQQGAMRLQEGKTDEAVALFDEAAKAAPGGKEGRVIADLARLKSALALMDDAPYEDTERRLKPLIEDGRPYKSVAREALALAKLKEGKLQEAKADFLILQTDLEAPQTITDRARAAVALIDSGSAPSVAAAVKSAAAMPAPSPMMGGIPPEILEQLQAQGIQLPQGGQ